MATTKLTLSTDEDTVQLAKRMAANNDLSVSKLFKKLITEFSRKDLKKDSALKKYEQKQFSDNVKALTGILKGKYPDDFDYRDAYREHLTKKNGL